MKINLLNRTIQEIEDLDFTPEDIIFIGSPESSHSCSWEEFKELAGDGIDNIHEYGHAVASDLQIVFKDGTILRRWQYDDIEGWESLDPFKMPKVKKKIKTLFGPDLGGTQDDG